MQNSFPDNMRDGGAGFYNSGFFGKHFLVPHAQREWGKGFEQRGAIVVYSWNATTFSDISESVEKNGGLVPQSYSSGIEKRFLLNANKFPDVPFIAKGASTGHVNVKTLKLPRGDYSLGLLKPRRLLKKPNAPPAFQKDEFPNVPVISYPSKEVEAEAVYGYYEIEFCLATEKAGEQNWQRLAVEPKPNVKPASLDDLKGAFVIDDTVWATYHGNDEKGRGNYAKYHHIIVHQEDRHKYFYRARQCLLDGQHRPLASSGFSPMWTYAPPSMPRKVDRPRVSPRPRSPSPALMARPLGSAPVCYQACPACRKRLPKLPTHSPSLDPLLLRSSNFDDSSGYHQEGSDSESEIEDLFNASKNGDGTKVSQLSQGVELNTQDSTGMTAVAWAARNRHNEVLEILVRAGADPNIPNKQGVYPLSWSTLYDNTKTTKLLIALGANVNVQSDKNTPLHFATIHACVKSVGRNTETSTVQLLVEKGASLHVNDGEGRTPLQIAQFFGNHQIINILDPLKFGGLSTPFAPSSFPMPWNSAWTSGIDSSMVDWFSNPEDVFDLPPPTPSTPEPATLMDVVLFYYEKVMSYFRRWL